jgi:hypothetical protein
MKLKEIPYVVPRGWKHKQEIAKNLEQYILDFINKSGLEPIDAVLELLDKNNIRVEDIEDYIPLMETFMSIVNPQPIKSSIGGLF